LVMASDHRIGTELAGYRVERIIGRGGMGIVYLAEDTRLGRKVALKLISPELAEDSRFRERFVIESRLAASLEHPNIVPIHAAGEADGVLYLAMRFIEGTDLRGLLRQEGELAPARAAELVAQVGRALDAAHSRGLVHRDVKPANILTSTMAHSEHFYLSDFGLTKQPTGASVLTITGQLIGTVDYLAPETIAGLPADGRVDQYALGCVLYECLTGQPPFHRDSEAATLWAHMQDLPPRLPESIAGHANLDKVLARALAKAPDDRFKSGADFAAATLGALPADSGAKSAFTGRRQLFVLAVAVLTIAAIGAAVIVAGGSGSGDSAAVPLAPANALIRIDPATNTMAGAPIPVARGPTQVAVSGDFVWLTSPSERVLQQVSPRLGNVVKTIRLSATPTGLDAQWDSSLWVAEGLAGSVEEVTQQATDVYVVRSTRLPRCCAGPTLVSAGGEIWVSTPTGLRRIDRETGPTGPLPATGNSGVAVDVAGNAWIANGWDTVRKFNVVDNRSFVTATAPGGPAGLAFGEGALWVPARYEDTLYEINPEVTDDQRRRYVTHTIHVGNSPCCVAVGYGAVWVANAAGGTVSRIDPTTARVTATIPVGERLGGIAVGAGGVWVTTQAQAVTGRVSGTLAFDDGGNIVVMNADGTGRRTITHTGRDSDPDWSPDGTTLVFSRFTRREPCCAYPAHLFTVRPNGTGLHQLTSGAVGDGAPAWSPDGRRIVFSRHPGTEMIIHADGTNLKQVTSGPHDGRATWSPDGQRIVFAHEWRHGSLHYLVSIDLDGSNRRVLSPQDGQADAPVWSPAGDLIAYSEAQTGLGSVQLTSPAGEGSVKLIDGPPGSELLGLAWSPDGSAIAFGGLFNPIFRNDIYVMNADGSGLVQLTHDHQAGAPSWQPTR
jgi:serine/threonine-protein kinase